jgi:hypothetical protein
LFKRKVGFIGVMMLLEWESMRIVGWRFWARDTRLSNLLMGGVETPFALRLLDRKRKNWDVARQAIIDVNKEADGL